MICQLREADMAARGLILQMPSLELHISVFLIDTRRQALRGCSLRHYEHECEKKFLLVRIFSHILKEKFPQLKS